MNVVTEILLLILIANGSPVIVSFLFSHKASTPIDFGISLDDQQALFGITKTWRGLISSIAITPMIALLIGFDVLHAFLIAMLAMAGDLLSSFIKRRLKKASSSRSFILDQLPESLFPTLLMSSFYHLQLIHIIVIVIAFTMIEIILSYLLFQAGIRKKPY